MSLPPEMKLSNQLRKDMLKHTPSIYNLPTADEMIGSGRKDKWQVNQSYSRQKRKFYLHNVKQQFIYMNWAFDNFKSTPRILADIYRQRTRPRHISHIFSEGNSTFYGFLERYFPEGI
jgi:hypothetical protein